MNRKFHYYCKAFTTTCLKARILPAWNVCWEALGMKAAEALVLEPNSVLGLCEGEGKREGEIPHLRKHPNLFLMGLWVTTLGGNSTLLSASPSPEHVPCVRLNKYAYRKQFSTYPLPSPHIHFQIGNAHAFLTDIKMKIVLNPLFLCWTG